MSDESPTGRTVRTVRRDEPKLQQIARPPVDKELIQALKEGEAARLGIEMPPIDYAKLELDLVLGMADFFSKKHPQPKGTRNPKNSRPFDVAEVVQSGASYFRTEPGYIGLTVSRRQEVTEKVKGVGTNLISLLFAYRNEIQKVDVIDSRKRRRAIEAVRKKIMSMMPAGVSLDEALKVLA